uniref:Vomeronasal type-1 receptor n=1 Tax=Moschus moschiferus TaxID=68415 RepID=A0A8C6CIL6_MOSMO
IMFPSEVIWGLFFIFQISIGFMGNSLLFMLCVYIFLDKNHLKKPINLICIHLTLVNALTILFKLIPDIVSSFGVKHFLDDVGSITINPVHSRWAWLRSKLSMCIYSSFLFFWITNMLIYIYIIETVEASHNVTIVGLQYSTLHCQTNQLRQNHSVAFGSVVIIRDLLFVILMMWSSLYTINLLYRHRQRAWHVHSPSLSPQSCPEIKATHTILLLVSCFVFFHCSNNFIVFYLFHKPEKNSGLKRITGIFSSCYPTICPFVLLKSKRYREVAAAIQKAIQYLPCHL